MPYSGLHLVKINERGGKKRKNIDWCVKKRGNNINEQKQLVAVNSGCQLADAHSANLLRKQGVVREFPKKNGAESAQFPFFFLSPTTLWSETEGTCCLQTKNVHMRIKQWVQSNKNQLIDTFQICLRLHMNELESPQPSITSYKMQL